MAQINKPTDYFNTKLYTGNGTTNTAITGIGFQPDLNWIKKRSFAGNNFLTDAVRGVGRHLNSENTNAENVYSEGIKSFDSDGITLGSGSDINENTETYVAWNWLASNTTASNTSGSITSTVSANTTSGFSIVSYTGTGSAGTIGHGLGSTPKMMLVKCRSNADTWAGYHIDVGATKYMELDTTAAAQISTQPWNDTEPTSSVFTVGNWSATNGLGRTYIAYCFAEKKGFSKFGSYTGNGSTDGTFVYTGFKPAMVIMKRTSASGTNWQLIDNKRSDAGGNNVIDKVLSPNASDAEYDEGSANWFADFVSNGFKIRNSFSASNSSGATYIYMAFASEPLVGTNNTPATAR